MFKSGGANDVSLGRMRAAIFSYYRHSIRWCLSLYVRRSRACKNTQTAAGEGEEQLLRILLFATGRRAAKD